MNTGSKGNRFFIQIIFWLTAVGGMLAITYFMGFSFKDMAIISFGGSLIGISGTCLSNWISGKKKSNIPAFDERTLAVLSKYFHIAFYMIMIISSILLIGLYSIGTKTVEIGWLFVYLSLIFVILGLGARAVKKIC